MLLVLGLVAGAGSGTAGGKEEAPAASDKASNVRLIKHFPFKERPYVLFPGATDIEFHGRFAYVTGGAGLHIYDLSRHKPRKVSFTPCAGAWPDVAFVRPGLVALAVDPIAGGGGLTQCATEGMSIALIDVSDPARPKIRGSLPMSQHQPHTVTAHPDGEHLYVSPGGLIVGQRSVSIIDVSNPDTPTLARTLAVGLSGCHDITFSFTRRGKLGFCATGTSPATEIWDASDPLDPQVIGRIVNPLISFHHYAFATADGKYLGLTDENFACAPAQGAVWFYDISDPTNPRLMSWFDMPLERTDPVNRYCTAHNFNFVGRSYKMALAWYQSGMNVIDFEDPSSPVEVAHYVTPDVDYWSAYFYRGRIFASDMERGLDVFKVQGL